MAFFDRWLIRHGLSTKPTTLPVIFPVAPPRASDIQNGVLTPTAIRRDLL